MAKALAEERAFVIRAAQTAGELCRRVQARMVQADSLAKKDKSPVTVADFGSQAVIARLLNEVFPSDPLVGEESAEALRQPDQTEIRERVVAEVQQQYADLDQEAVLHWIDSGRDHGGKHRFWTLDPIDGTKGFLRKQQYAIALALVENGEVKVGMLGCPNLPLSLVNPGEAAGCIFVAVRGEGTTMMALDGSNERPVHASQVEDFTPYRTLESVEAAHGDHSAHDQIKQTLGIGGESVRLDSQAKYGVLSRGEAEVYLRMPTRADYREKIWDQAAGSIVIEEAGGVVTDALGQKLDFSQGRRLENNRGIVASCGPHHSQIIEAIRQVAPAHLD